MGYIIKWVIVLLVGIVFILAGIFKWYIVLALFSKYRPPSKDWEVTVRRVCYVIMGLLLVIGAFHHLKIFIF